MRILVTGSRDWPDYGTVQAAILREVGQVRRAHEPVTIVHGAATGADTMADKVAIKFGFRPEPHPVTRDDWVQHGKRAGMKRNAHMVWAGADVCVACIKDKSKGATMCADMAEKAGIRTVRYEIATPSKFIDVSLPLEF